jgi:hypothetical protein
MSEVVDPFWSWIDGLLPGKQWISYAVDASGMRAVFSSVPVYHPASKKWTLMGPGDRKDIGLLDVGVGFDGSKTLLIRPGFEAIAAAVAPQVDKARMGALAHDVTDPKKKGPDAWVGAIATEMTPEMLSRANAEAMGLGRQLSGTPDVAKPDPTTYVGEGVAKVLVKESMTGPVFAAPAGVELPKPKGDVVTKLIALVVALAEEVPPSRRKHIENELKALKEAL